MRQQTHEEFSSDKAVRRETRALLSGERLKLRETERAVTPFAVPGRTGVSRPGGSRAALNECDRAIAESTIGMAIRCWFVCSTIPPIAIGSIGGWDRTVSFAILARTAWLAWIVVLTVQATAPIHLHSVRSQ